MSEPTVSSPSSEAQELFGLTGETGSFCDLSQVLQDRQRSRTRVTGEKAMLTLAKANITSCYKLLVQPKAINKLPNQMTAPHKRCIVHTFQCYRPKEQLAFQLMLHIQSRKRSLRTANTRWRDGFFAQLLEFFSPPFVINILELKTSHCCEQAIQLR